MGSKKHKKHKSEKRDRYEDKQLGTAEKPPALKLILKVGSSSTPEHSDSPGPSVSNYSVATTSFIEEAEEEEVDKDSLLVRTDGHRRVFDEGGAAVRQGSEDNSRLSIQAAGGAGLGSAEASRRIVASGTVMGGLGGSEERHRRAKKKKKKRERDKHEKRHKHHHKEKRKRMRGGSSQEDDVESGMGGSHRRREGGEMSIGVHDGGGHRVASETSGNAGTYVGGTVPSGVQVAGASVGSVNSPSSQHLPPPAKRPCLQQTPQGQYGEPLAPNQGSANLEGSGAGNVMGQSASQTANSTPAGNNSAGANQQGNNAAALGSREPRSCVLRQRQQERAPLQRLLEHLLRTLERRDPHHFFAWPVTDSIAPGYSRIIRRPMDFSTMKQKIDEGMYATLGEYVEDFKLMCNNAMVYNHPDTIYYKAAKRLLHVGLRTMTPEKIRPLASVLPSLARLTRRELGFELNLPPPPQPPQQTASANASAHGAASGEIASVKQEGEDEVSMEGVVEGGVSNDGEQRVGNEEGDEDYEDNEEESRRDLKRRSMRTKPGSKFEAIADDMTPEEILAQAKKAASDAAQKLSLKRAGAKMGFLRQRRDGTTSLAVLIPGDGVTPGSNEKPVSLGALVGKLTHGTGQLQGFREDRRNAAKTVKPLYYGSFGSYAPSYDSTFANLTKDESDLVYSTYGDETAVQYAESILDFAKDCDYALKMVDNLLDIVTGGEHRRTMRTIEEHRRKTRGEGDDEGGRYKRYLLEAEKNASNAQSDSLSPKPSVNSSDPTSASTGNSADPYDVKIDFEALKTLSDVGIDVSFLDNVENDIKNEALQRGLDQTGDLIGKLEQVQRERLSQPPPAHLALVPKPSEIEVQLAEKITENLTDMAKKVTPEAIAPLPALRKAMGISPPVCSGKLSTVTSTGNPSMSMCEEIADDEDEESEVSGSRLSRSDPSTGSAPSVQNGTAPSEIKISSSMDEAVIKSDESRMLRGGNLSTETEGIVSKLQEGVLKEVNLEDSHLDQPMKVEEGLPAKKVCEDEKSLTLKEEIADSSVADQGLCPPLGTTVDVGAGGEPGNILISDIKVESTDQTGMESSSTEKDNVLFGKENEIITKQDMVVGGDHMASDCIIGGSEDNVLGSISGLGDATCAELGAILAGSENKSDLSKVQVESGRISDVSRVQGSMVSEGIGMVTGTVSSNLASSVTASGHMPSTSASMVRNANSLVAGRGGTSGGGMSVVVVEAGGVVEEVEVPDLESELREFLENEPALGGSPLQDDKTIEEILSES